MQRFDSAHRLNVHSHLLALDGVYVDRNAGNATALVFMALPAPSADEPHDVTLEANERHPSPVEDMAKSIVYAMEKGDRVCYTPTKWKYIMLIIRSLPMVVFGKLDV